MTKRYLRKYKDFRFTYFVLYIASGLIMFLPECSATKNGTPTGMRGKLYLCIHNCAMCVTTWEPGLYNGHRCALRCIRNKGRKLVDPDCNNIGLFNHNAHVFQKYLKRLRHHSGIEKIT
ncbi:uncharacterized protein LOC143231138 [Tachypleus tridentatus]|uniref:uncharacterized protein LOC143231138 n=1 Tax=Tachypleus tridentatus TaxID=6853 RepID=UPI003FD03A07